MAEQGTLQVTAPVLDAATRERIEEIVKSGRKAWLRFFGLDESGADRSYVNFGIKVSTIAVLEERAKWEREVERLRAELAAERLTNADPKYLTKEAVVEAITMEVVQNQKEHILEVEARAETAERELKEAREAIRWYDGRGTAEQPEFPSAADVPRYRFRSVAQQFFPAVRAALEGK